MLRDRRRHPAPATFSRYLDGDVSTVERKALEAHVRDCLPCRRLLVSLSDTVRGLRTLRAPERTGQAERIVAMFAASAGDPGAPRLAIVDQRTTMPTDAGWRPRARAAVRYCFQRSQLRLTLPIGLLVGAALSFANKGSMLLEGEIDLKMCVVCGMDFLLPFVAMNIVLLTATRMARRR